MTTLDCKRFKALGKTWTARFDFNSAIALEEIYDQSFMEIVAPFLVRLDETDRHNPEKAIAAAKAIKFGDIRTILEEALRGEHPEITTEEVGLICAAIGIGEATAIVGWAIVQALPTPEGDDDSNDHGGGATGDANPPKKAMPNRKVRRAAAATG
jgi:hypothetical protein